MNNILKITSVIIIVLFVMSNETNAQHVVEASEVDFENGVLVKYKGSFKDIIIPSSFDGIPLEVIGFQAFLNTNIEKVVISTGIKYLEEHSLSNNPIRDIKLNDGLLIIGKAAFANCDFDSLNIPQSVEIIGDDAFFGCNLKKMSFSEPSSIKYIGEGAFCYAMCDVIFPENSNEGFEKYVNEDNLEFSEHDIIDVWKTYWSILPNHTIQENEVEFEEGKLMNYFGTYTNITIPSKIGNDSIFSIEEFAFDNKYLINLYLSEGLQNIGNYSFRNNFLSFINLPNSVKTVGKMAFAANRLRDIELQYSTIDIGNGAFNCNKIENINNSITNGLFYKNLNSTTDSTIVISYGGAEKSVDFIPNKVKIIDESAFETVFGYDGINYVLLPDSLIKIGNYAFIWNDIEHLILPESLSEIGFEGFGGNKLDSLTIPSSIIEIGDYAFHANDSLKYVTFNKNSNLITIGINLFSQTLIDTLFLPSPIIPIGYDQFLGWYKNDDTITMDMPLLNCNDYNQPSLTAKFSLIYYKIIYKNVGTRNDTLNPIFYTIEDQIYSLNLPYDSIEYTFAGWYTDSLFNDSVEIGFISRGSIGDTVLFAKWEAEIVDVKSKETIYLNVYPNPTTDFLSIECGTIPYNIKVYNSLGLKLIDETTYNKKSEINLTNFHHGIYFISTQTKNKRSTVKIVKK